MISRNSHSVHSNKLKYLRQQLNSFIICFNINKKRERIRDKRRNIRFLQTLVENFLLPLPLKQRHWYSWNKSIDTILIHEDSNSKETCGIRRFLSSGSIFQWSDHSDEWKDSMCLFFDRDLLKLFYISKCLLASALEWTSKEPIPDVCGRPETRMFVSLISKCFE